MVLYLVFIVIYFVLSNKIFDSYSSDLYEIDDLINKPKFTDHKAHLNIYTILSPRFYFKSSKVYEMMGNIKEAEKLLNRGKLILDCILQSGNGTKNKPYKVLLVEDEKDLLDYILKEKMVSQSLVFYEEKKLDIIKCASGKEFVFDITDFFGKHENLLYL